MDVRLPPLLMGLISMMAAVCVCLFPETKGIMLPEYIEDMDGGPLWSTLFGKSKRKHYGHNVRRNSETDEPIFDYEYVKKHSFASK